MKVVKAMKKEWFLSAVVLMMLMFMIGKVDVKAANVVETQTKYGITWTMYDDGVLTIQKPTDADSCIIGSNGLFAAKEYDTDIKRIIIEAGVTYIGQYAFCDFSNFSSITIPNSVTGIGDGAFAWCSSLKSITIPNSVTDIGDEAFYGCSSLKSITIPNKVTYIHDRTFEYCTNLKSVTIPNSVTYIDKYAFSHCEGLASITIPNSVTDIEEGAFEGCTSLKSVTISNKITTISRQAFKSCSSLKKVKIPKSVTTIGEEAFEDCYNLTSITIPNKVKTIGSMAFKNCTSLKSVTIPKSVDYLESEAFEQCTNLVNVKLLGVLSEYADIDNVFYGTRWLLNKKGTISGWSQNFTYVLDKSGTLTIKGSGIIEIPWDISKYKSLVTTVIISNNAKKVLFKDHTFGGYFRNLTRLINKSSASVELSFGSSYAWYNEKDKNTPITTIAKGTAIKITDKDRLQYNIYFDYDYSHDYYNLISGSMNSIKGKAGQRVSIPQNAYDVENFRFTKWQYKIGKKTYTLKSGASLFISKADYKKYNIESIKLVAQWENDPNYGSKRENGTVLKDANTRAQYIVTSNNKKSATVTYKKSFDKKISTVSIPATVRISGISYKVTAVEEKAFYGCSSLEELTLLASTTHLGKLFVGNCKKLKTLTIKSTKLTKSSIKNGAFSKIGDNVVIKVPKNKVSAYTKLFQSKGLGKKVKVKAGK